jgi:hypothetical protein
MKRTLAIIILCGAALTGGCSDSEIHIDKLQAAFQAMPADQKTKLETGVSALAASQYAAALPPLQAFAFGTKMNDEQRKILTDTIAKVSAKVREQK